VPLFSGGLERRGAAVRRVAPAGATNARGHALRRILAAVVEMCDAKEFVWPLWILVRAVGAEDALTILEERTALFLGDPECVLSPDFHTALAHMPPHAARRDAPGRSRLCWPRSSRVTITTSRTSASAPESSASTWTPPASGRRIVPPGSAE
jgi:hypothetical protein